MTTETMESVLVSWSGGKDSAMALYELGKAGGGHVLALLTTVTEGYERISMHGVREALLDRQAAAVGLQLCKVRIPRNSSMEEYETRMRRTLEHYRGLGVSSVVFGDIRLEDLKKDREDKLAQIGLRAAFPIWQRDTAELASTFLDVGFKAVITCVDTQMLDGAFAGRIYDRQLLRDLPAGVDPGGENGEFHSFVYDGPIFREPVAHRTGQVVLRDDRFCFCDLLAAE